MPENKKNDAHEKALSLNLDGTIFGSFAEIGAGQEVARWFLRVGGASGTVAKTISASLSAGGPTYNELRELLHLAHGLYHEANELGESIVDEDAENAR